MKNNFITKIIGATLAFAMMIGGAVGINTAKEAKRVFADDTPASFSAGTNAVAIKVNYNSAGAPSSNNGVRVGTSSTAGEATFTIPSGTTKFGFYAVGWKDKATTASVSASVGTIATATAALTSNSAATGSINANATVAITETEANAKKEFTISNVTASSTITLTTSGSNRRLIAWNAWYESSSGATYSVTYDGNGATGGTAPVDETEYESGDVADVIGNTGNLVKENYYFGGWTDGENEYESGDSFEVTTNVTLRAIWNAMAGFDYLTRNFTGIANGANTYSDWSEKTGQSGAVYAGNSAGGNDSIQLRDSNNSGVVSTTSGGNVKKVTVIWESNTANGRTLNIYGKDTAYSSPADLYSQSTRGTLLGTIVKGTTTSHTITGDYRYVGVCSNSGAMYLTELHFKWEEVQLEPRVTLDKTSVELKTTQTNGTTVTAFVEDVASPEYTWESNNANVTLENDDTATVTIKPNTNVAASSTITLTVGGTNPNLTATVEVTISVPGPGESIEKAFTVAQARAHIDSVVTGGEATGNDGNKYYATGIVSEIVTAYNSQYGNITYNISNDGSTSGDQLQAYRGKGINGENFTSEDDIMVGDTVVVYGFLKVHNDTYEFDQNNELISRVAAPQVNSITLTPSTVTVDVEEVGNVVDLFTNITINQDPGSTKTVNDIVWSSDDDSVLYIADGEYLVAGAHRTSTTIRASIGGQEYGHATVNVFKSNTHVMEYDLPEEWRKVNNPSTLVAGDQVILTGIKGGVLYAAGTYSSGSNVQADTTNTLTDTNGVADGVQESMIYTLEAGTEDGSVAFKDSAGKYLYAASSSNNNMKSQATIDGNASFILNANGTVVAQGSNSRKYMRYNNDNDSNLFSCYSSSSTAGTLVTFYKLSTGTAELDLFNLAAVQSAHEDENGAYINLGASLSAEDWAAIQSAFGISGYGVMLIRETTLETTGFDTIEELYNSESADKSKLANLGKNSETAPQDYSIEAKINITNESNRSVVFCAAAYVKSSSGTVYFINETRGSLVGLL